MRVAPPRGWDSGSCGTHRCVSDAGTSHRVVSALRYSQGVGLEGEAPGGWRERRRRTPYRRACCECVPRLGRPDDRLRPCLACRDGGGEHVQLHPVASGLVAEALERLVDVDLESFCEHAFRLLNHDPGCERGSQLFVLPAQSALGPERPRHSQLQPLSGEFWRAQVGRAHSPLSRGWSSPRLIVRRRSKPVTWKAVIGVCGPTRTSNSPPRAC